MNLNSFFGKKKKTAVKTHSSYNLSPLGKTKAEEYAVSGPKGNVMVAINEIGPASVKEICEETKYNPEKVKAILRELIRSGYVRKASEEEE